MTAASASPAEAASQHRGPLISCPPPSLNELVTQVDHPRNELVTPPVICIIFFTHARLKKKVPPSPPRAPVPTPRRWGRCGGGGGGGADDYRQGGTAPRRTDSAAAAAAAAAAASGAGRPSSPTASAPPGLRPLPRPRAPPGLPRTLHAPTAARRQSRPAVHGSGRRRTREPAADVM
jgi:hypothetical protein